MIMISTLLVIILPSPKMPKSGHMANSQLKFVSAIVRNLSGKDVNQKPVNNTCYSFVSDDEVIHVAAVYKYNEKKINGSNS